jgi:hypothetical protein
LNLTTGYYNTGIGNVSLYYNTTGTYNTALGWQSGNNNTRPDNIRCTFLGANTGNSSATSYDTSVAIGYNAVINHSNQIVLGTASEGVFLPGDYLKIGGSYTSKGYNGYELDVTGDLYVSGQAHAVSFNGTSDYRIKENVTPLNNLFTVDNLNPVTYTNTKTDKQDIGLIAHELQEHYPFLVNGIKDGENLQSINYIGLIGILIKEIQILKADIVRLDANDNQAKK